MSGVPSPGALSHLAGRRLVITGAAGGLGPVAATAAAEAGARIVLVDIDQAKVDALAAEVGDAVELACAVDLLDADTTSAFAASLGDVDAIWHLVGGWKGGTPLEEQPLEDLALLHDLAVRTTWHVARAFTPALMSSHHGRFASVSSPQATRPSSANAAYGAMKAASDAIVLALADRLAESSATANIVVVPAIMTPAMRAKNPNRQGFVAAEDIAQALVYLTSDAAAKMNGQRLRLTPSGA